MRIRRLPGESLALATLKWRSPVSAISVGERLLGQGHTDGARVAFQRAIDSGHVDGAPAGMWWMATLLRHSGDNVGATEFFARAIEFGHRAWSPRAAVDLAALREDQGDVEGAIALYELALDSGDPTRSDGANIWSRRAATKLEILLTRQDEVAKARAVYERATGGVLEKQAWFAINRAHELQERGDLYGAAASLREAIELDDPRVSPQAATLLSVLRMR
jgi:tetratricopeptide (TPR) repeat protein